MSDRYVAVGFLAGERVGCGGRIGARLGIGGPGRVVSVPSGSVCGERKSS